jgi:subtilase family serine protease
LRPRLAFKALLIAVTAAASVAGSAAGSRSHISSRPVCRPVPTGSAFCHAKVVTSAAGMPLTSSLPYGYGPTQFQTAYGLTSAASTPSTQTIAIVDAYDDPTAASDLAVYSSTYGLPSCTTANGCFTKVNQHGGTQYPRGDQAWALEISLDLQVSHAVCPHCKLLLVEATSNKTSSLTAAEAYAATHGTVVSNSWGSNEFSREGSYDANFEHQGVPITVSSGDNGYGVQWPASSPYVTAVGGTTLTLNGDNTRSSESVWSGAGSGCSAYESKPTWQLDSACAARTVSDVSADADPSTGASVYDSYGYQYQSGWFVEGGTSLSAPLIAAVYALAGNGSSTTFGSYPYAHPAGLYDVTSGNNGWWCGNYLCLAGVGYDGPTGLGTPNGTSSF